MLELFSPIENILAERLLAPFLENQEADFFIKTLLLAAKKGHLCLHMGNIIEPHLQSLVGVEGMEDALRNSLEKMPDELIEKCKDELFATRPICQLGNYFYLQRFYIAETIVFREWQRLLQETFKPCHLNIDEGLLSEQKEAIQLACQRDFVILSGGPGTGKTFTAGRMVKAVLETSEKANFRIALAAPTGKAAANLESAIKKVLPSTDMTGKTLHSLLNNSSDYLPYDFVLVDESSMIDIELMASLLSAIKNGTKLVLIGDENQLPPVEAGGIFSDLKAIHPYSVTLNKCVRAELRELAEFGACINKGDSKGALDLIDQKTISLIEPSKIKLKSFLDEMADQFAQDKNKSFCLLSPLRQGPYGSEAINKTILSSIRKRVKGPLQSPIMIATNDHKKGLFNGEFGLLTKHHSLSDHFSAEDFAIFSSDRRFFALLLPRFEYAYCLSVHKSQGSEFDEVMLILPEGSETFGRKIIYTAATRAKKKMIIYGTKETLCKTLQSNMERFSGFNARITKP